jgi:hypothetical protein
VVAVGRREGETERPGQAEGEPQADGRPYGQVLTRATRGLGEA